MMSLDQRSSAPADVRDPAMALDWRDPLWLTMVYLGAQVALPQYLSVDVGPLLGALVLTGLVALLAWSKAEWTPPSALYLKVAVAFSIWVYVCAVAAWSPSLLYGATGFVAWIVFLIPGLGFLLRHPRYRYALVLGMSIGVAVYAVAVLFRLVRGMPVLDAFPNGTRIGGGLILNRNRNLVSMNVLTVMPFLLVPAGPRLLRRLRWPLLVGGVVAIFFAGGRSGVLGLAMFGLIVAVIQPSVGRKSRALVGALIAAVLFVIVTQAIGGQAASSTNRVLNFVHGQRDTDDQARELAGRKAWHIAIGRPFFGTGYGNFEHTYDPVIEEAPNERVRDIVANGLTAHNTYAKVLAENGFPGIVLFGSVLLALVFMGARRAFDREARFFTAGLAGLLTMIFVDAVLGAMLFVPMAIMLGVLNDSSRRMTTEATDG